MANFHKVPLHTEAIEDGFLFETLLSTQLSTQYLPMLKGMLRHTTIIFTDPVSARIITSRVDKKYKPSLVDPTRPTLDTLVVATACK